MSTHFRDLVVNIPTVESVSAAYQQVTSAWESATNGQQRLDAIQRWDTLRRDLESWDAMTELRFQQDTRNLDYKRAREYLDEMRPKLTEFAVVMKRALLSSPHRAEMERTLGAQAFELWAADVLTYDPAIESDIVAEAKLQAEYTELTASAQFSFQGESLNLSAIVKYREHANRVLRHDAEVLRWGWMQEHRAELDRIYDELVKLRTAMARKLGFDSFVQLAYKRMKRVDYNQQNVEQFRSAVREQLIPLCVELRRQQATTLAVDPLMFWDESVLDPRGNPQPKGDHDWMVARAQKMFDRLSPELSQFFRLMVEGDLMDLKNREGKAPGGFCTSFPSHGVPYIFANFNGTKGDVEVFTHEMGHAFQSYMSRNQPLVDYLWPTYESCEIHSMGLEFLAWPQMEKFFEEDAERFRTTHLTQSLLFIPYGVAVDHFQHLVYDRPEATPAERHAMWQEVERIYLPWRKYGDLPHVADGGLWQMQRHIYLAPFYYIDYTLAQTCALQLWARARQNFRQTMDAYVALCRRGGEAPFQQLASSAGLVSPFAKDCLRDVVTQARNVLIPA